MVAVSETTRDPYLFRSYGVEAEIEKCSIVDACLATSAATKFFPAKTVNNLRYVDGGFGKNNPSRAAIAELKSANWQSPLQDAIRDVACFVSIGTGLPTFRRKTSSSWSGGLDSIKTAVKLCVDIATDCHNEHLDVLQRYHKS